MFGSSFIWRQRDQRGEFLLEHLIIYTFPGHKLFPQMSVHASEMFSVTRFHLQVRKFEDM